MKAILLSLISYYKQNPIKIKIRLIITERRFFNFFIFAINVFDIIKPGQYRGCHFANIT